VKGTSFDEATPGFDQHGYTESYHLLLSGVIRSISIRSRTELCGFEKPYTLTRYCQVAEDSQLLVQRDGSLVSAANRKPENESFEEISGQMSIIDGTFFADYRFWNTESELQEVLQHVHFLLLGTDEDTDHSRIAGMVLKPRSRQLNESHCRYERIGWLRYYPPGAVEIPEWMSQGTTLTLKLF
jgi:hypothetical protein